MCGMLLQFFEIWNSFQGRVAAATPSYDIAKSMKNNENFKIYFLLKKNSEGAKP